MIVLWWALGMGYAKVYSEAYPSLMMPGFPGTAGLRGDVTDYPALVVAADLPSGQTVEHPVTDLMTGVPVHMRGPMLRKTVKLGRNDAGEASVTSVAPGFGDTLRSSIAQQHGVNESDVRRLELRVYRHRYHAFADHPGPEVSLRSTHPLTTTTDAPTEPTP